MIGRKCKNRNMYVVLFCALLFALNVYCEIEVVEIDPFMTPRDRPTVKEYKIFKIRKEPGTSADAPKTRSGQMENFLTMKKITGIHDDVGVIDYSRMVFSHGESPVWDPDSQTLYWVDVLDQTVHALEFTSFKYKARRIDYGEVNVVIPVVDSDALLIGCKDKVFLMHWNRTELTLIASLEPDKPRNIFNEGKCDALGRLWAGTKGPQIGDTVEPQQAGLYKIEPPCYEPRTRLRHVTISNGMAWALNNSVLYYIDSVTHQVEAFDYDIKMGRLSNRRSVLNTTQWGYDYPTPDGMTIDRDGKLWVAIYFYGKILRIDPDLGLVIREYQLPVLRVTSLAWAGAAMEDLVITTSRRNVAERALHWPLSGTIFVLRALGTGGVPDHKFRYQNTSCHQLNAKTDFIYT